MLKACSTETIHQVRKMEQEHLYRLHRSLGMWVRNEFDLWSENSALRKELDLRHPDDASSAIILSFWNRLQQSERSTEKTK